jgi:hypothetical protein
LLASADALKPAKRWSIVTFDCDDWSCSSTAAFVDRPSSTLLAVAHVKKPKSDDEDADRDALEKMLGQQLGKWK